MVRLGSIRFATALLSEPSKFLQKSLIKPDFPFEFVTMADALFETLFEAVLLRMRHQNTNSTVSAPNEKSEFNRPNQRLTIAKPRLKK